MAYERSAKSWVKGSMVYLANGEEKPIEELVPATQEEPNGGDIITTLNGSNAYVVGIMVGPEEPEVIRLMVEVVSTVETGKTFTTTINESHAVLNDEFSLVPANALRVNDSIQTIYGRAIVREKTSLDSTDDLWQFFLASKEFVDNIVSKTSEKELYRYLSNSLLGLSINEHLVFVDGVLSGDWILQSALAGKIRKGVSLTDLY